MEDKSLNNFAKQLASFKPAAPSEDFALRLEAAIAEADAELAQAKVIVHPFAQPLAQWATAAAALVVGLFMAVQSTRTNGSADPAPVAKVSTAQQPDEVLPVYRVIDGRLAPVNDNRSMQMVRYRGLEVMEGRAFRQFSDGKETFFQPVFSKPGDIKTSDN